MTKAEASALLAPGKNVWRVERTGRAAFIVDAADYYRLARHAMLQAESQIILLGWDLDTRIKMVAKDEAEGAPAQLGRFLVWLAKRRPQLKIYILAWGGEAFNFLGRGTTMIRLAHWRFFRRNIDFRLDTAHPLAGSHHQKILVIDDRFACCGGIDMTAERWDTRAHRDHEPGRHRPTTHRHYGPWHDATMAVDEDAAVALGDLARRRWEVAIDRRIDPPDVRSDPWPKDLAPHFTNVKIGIARTCGQTDRVDEVREIETLFRDMIRSARRHIYVESQYFASRPVAEAVVERLSEEDPPEIVIVNPHSTKGWLEEPVMGAARAEFWKAACEADHRDRFRLYYPVTEEGQDIYVHAKVMIIDDRLFRVGSANLNNRSMGLDSECDIVVDAASHPDADVEATIRAIRADLIAEHLGAEPEAVEKMIEESGSLIAAIERLRRPGRTLVRFEAPEFSEFSKAVAKSEVADPESADQPFEPTAQHRLTGRIRRRLRQRRAARAARRRG